MTSHRPPMGGPCPKGQKGMNDMMTKREFMEHIRAAAKQHHTAAGEAFTAFQEAERHTLEEIHARADFYSESGAAIALDWVIQELDANILPWED